MSKQPSPCPYCGDAPDVGRCEPWPKDAGPQPWYVSCYKGGDAEHHVGENGYTRAEAIENWELELKHHRPSPTPKDGASKSGGA